MKKSRGFIWLDSLFAMLILAFALSPLLVLQAQARRDLQQAASRDLALLLAANLAEQIRSQAPLDSYAALAQESRLQFQMQCPGCRRISVNIKAHKRSDSRREAPAYEVAMFWHDPQPQNLHLLALRYHE
jgi:Tfp pilus assembly protein PilV